MNKIVIEIKDFLKTCEFGPVKIGMKKEEVMRLLGSETMVGQYKHGYWYLFYGAYDFTFDSYENLFAIQNDDQIYEFENETIFVDPWCFRSDEKLTLESVVNLLKSEKISYQIEEGQEIIRLASGIRIDVWESGTERNNTAIRYYPDVELDIINPE